MKRRFFRKPIIKRIDDTFYDEMVQKLKLYREENCKQREDGSFTCSKCPFALRPYCLINILINEFDRDVTVYGGFVEVKDVLPMEGIDLSSLANKKKEKETEMKIEYIKVITKEHLNEDDFSKAIYESAGVEPVGSSVGVKMKVDGKLYGNFINHTNYTLTAEEVTEDVNALLECLVENINKGDEKKDLPVGGICV